MAITNPERVATKQDLKDFYDIIFPYLGGNAEAGFTPIGTIIAVMGNSAPTNYLACNGQVVNIADYPELANYFLAQFGSRNKFGGDGTTTFGIPDLRGEFLRGTGTNSHTNQGNGATVGTHQDATAVPTVGTTNTSKIMVTRFPSSGNIDRIYADSIYSTGTKYGEVSVSTNTYDSGPAAYTTRPTNTSVLYCIATKNIYMNPALDYTTEEKVIGQWIDGSPLYQTVLTNNSSWQFNTSEVAINEMTALNIDVLVNAIAINKDAPGGDWIRSTISDVRFYRVNGSGTWKTICYRAVRANMIILQYTKTTD